MDMASITILAGLPGETVIPLFKPGDHARLDLYLGMPADHHEPAPAGTSLLDTDLGISIEFYAGPEDGTNPDGRLKDGAAFSKANFAAYANAITVTKLMYLMETPPDGELTSSGQLSKLYSKLDDAVAPGPGTYDFKKLNLHGAHGGNILTSTLPGVAGDAVWMDTIDADNVWRADSHTITTALFRVNTDNDQANPAVFVKSGLAAGQYKVYATWSANVTQDVPNLANPGFPNQKLLRGFGRQ